MTIKQVIALALVLLPLSVILMASLRTTVTLKWDYPADEIPKVVFKIYFTTNLSDSVWEVVAIVSNDTCAVVPVYPGNGFFFATASNEFGESIPSNTVTTTVPRFIRSLKYENQPNAR